MAADMSTYNPHLDFDLNQAFIEGYDGTGLDVPDFMAMLETPDSVVAPDPAAVVASSGAPGHPLVSASTFAPAFAPGITHDPIFYTAPPSANYFPTRYPYISTPPLEVGSAGDSGFVYDQPSNFGFDAAAQPYGVFPQAPDQLTPPKENGFPLSGPESDSSDGSGSQAPDQLTPPKENGFPLSGPGSDSSDGSGSQALPEPEFNTEPITDGNLYKSPYSTNFAGWPVHKSKLNSSAGSGVSAPSAAGSVSDAATAGGSITAPSSTGLANVYPPTPGFVYFDESGVSAPSAAGSVPDAATAGGSITEPSSTGLANFYPPAPGFVYFDGSGVSVPSAAGSVSDAAPAGGFITAPSSTELDDHTPDFDLMLNLSQDFSQMFDDMVENGERDQEQQRQSDATAFFYPPPQPQSLYPFPPASTPPAYAPPAYAPPAYAPPAYAPPAYAPPAYAPPASASTTNTAAIPIKRGRGRPVGSKNKVSKSPTSSVSSAAQKKVTRAKSGQGISLEDNMKLETVQSMHQEGHGKYRAGENYGRNNFKKAAIAKNKLAEQNRQSQNLTYSFEA